MNEGGLLGMSFEVKIVSVESTLSTQVIPLNSFDPGEHFCELCDFA